MVENSFPQKIAMRYLDRSEYTVIFNDSGGTIPETNPGRGLVELDHVYEFQSALIFDEVNFDANLNYVLTQLKKSLPEAPCIPVMPRIVSYDNIKEEITSLNMTPVGLELSSNCVLNYDFSKFINLVVYSNEKMAASFISCLIRVLHDLDSTKIIVLDSIGVANHFDDVQLFDSNFKKIGEALYKNISEKKNTDPDEKIIFIISGYQKINIHLKKLKEEDDSVKTIDDLIMNSVNSDKFKYIIVNDNRLSSIDGKDWADYLDYGFGIILSTEKDEQSLIDTEDSYDEVNINKDTAIVVDDYKKKYVKFIRDRS